jgi:hypothetical protein
MKLWTEVEIEYLRKNYLQQTRKTIGDHLGRSEKAVINKCNKLGLVNNNPISQEDTEAIRKWYEKHTGGKLNLDELAEKLGRNKATVCKVAKSLGLTDLNRTWHVPPKPKYATEEERREAVSKYRKQAWIDNPHPKGMLGKKHSDETKALLSELSKEAQKGVSKAEMDLRVEKALNTKMNRYGTLAPNSIKNGNAYSRSRGGTRKDLGFYVRSSWEANYARYLNWLQKNGEILRWEYEPDEFEFPIKRGTRFYIPDFKVFETSGAIVYHEVKGWMDAKSKTKLDRMSRHHPNVKVIVIDKAAYGSIARTLGKTIENWE